MDELAANAPSWLFLALLIPFAVGMALLRWGGSFPRKGDWLAALAVLGILGTVIATRSLDAVATSGLATGAALRGWIWPREESGAILVGFIRDPLSFGMSCLIACVAGLAVVNRALVGQEKRAERLHAAAAIGVSGVVLAWHAYTAWLGFAGIMIAVFSGFIAQGVRWGDPSESAIASRYAGERATAWVISLLGAAALSSAGARLIPGDHGVPLQGGLAILGAWLLTFGLAAQTQPLPFLGWLSMRSESVPVARAVFAQIVPGLAAFAMLVRFETHLEALGVFPLFGWLMAASSVLSALSGLLQEDWRRALGFWITSAFGLCMAALGVAGSYAAVQLLIGFALAGAAFAFIGGTGCDSKRAAWSRSALILAACAGSGMIGFVSCTGTLATLQAAAGNPTYLAAMIFVHLMTALLAWKLAWKIPAARDPQDTQLAYNLLPYLALVGALAIFWTGAVSGGAIPGAPDAILESLMALAFPRAPFAVDDGNFLVASWAHWGTLFVAVGLAYLTQARGEDLWQKVGGSFPRVAAFIRNGYGIDFVVHRILSGVGLLGDLAYRWVDLKFWRDWFPSGMRWVLTRSSYVTTHFTTRVSSLLNGGVHRATDVPAKMLQLVQSGDVQWYLFFAIGSGIVMLIHFLRFQ